MTIKGTRHRPLHRFASRWTQSWHGASVGRISLPNMHPVHRSLVLDNAEQLWGMDPETASELHGLQMDTELIKATLCMILLPKMDPGLRSLMSDDSKKSLQSKPFLISMGRQKDS